MDNRNTIALDDVLNEFVMDNDRPTAEVLEKCVHRYPEYRRELVDFAATWAEQLVLPRADELGAEVEKSLIDRTMSHVLNLVYEQEHQVAEPSETNHTIDSLIGSAQHLGMSAQEFAKSCGLDLLLISKLNNRQIRPQTIPVRLIRHIGRLLQAPWEAVSEYIALPPKSLTGKAYLARGKPESTGQQDFADAIRASSLTEPEKARWIDEAARGDEA